MPGDAFEENILPIETSRLAAIGLLTSAIAAKALTSFSLVAEASGGR